MSDPTPVWVWAPAAQKVDLVTDAGRSSMSPDGDGHWWGQLPTFDTPYGFSLDGGPTRPDPRAERLSDGVHGPCRRFDPGTFHWNDQGFRAVPLSAAVIYELHVGTFSTEGTFDGVVSHLDHLIDLGVTHVELMPVASFPGQHGWGYDGVGLFAVHEPYGGPEGLCRMVDACHRRGLGVILDVVYNHLGPEGNYLAEFGPYFTDRVHTPWGNAVNLDDRGCEPVRRFFLDNVRWWLEGFHLDGLRLDAVHAFEDRSALPFLEQMSCEVAALEAQVGRPLVLIAESDLNDPRIVRPRQAHGLGMDAQWADDLHHALHAQLTGEDEGYYQDFGGWGPVAKGLRSPYVIDGVHSSFRQRRHGRPNDAPGHRFVVYAQTHDQVGNRAAGERLHQLCGVEGALAAAALVLTSPGVPMLFMGEEWAASSPFAFFCDFEDPKLRRAVRDGRRREFAAFGWSPDRVLDPVDPSTFEQSRLDWTELERPEHSRVLEAYRTLVRLRRRLPELTDGDWSAVEVDWSERHLRVRRGRVRVAVASSEVTLNGEPEGAELWLASHPGVRLDGGSLFLPAASTAVYGTTRNPSR